MDEARKARDARLKAALRDNLRKRKQRDLGGNSGPADPADGGEAGELGSAPAER